MSRTVRVLADGSVISAGPSPAAVQNGVFAYTMNPSDVEKIIMDYTGWLGDETISGNVTWTPFGLTVGNVTTATPETSALISDVPQTSYGQVQIAATSSSGRVKNLFLRFYGYSINQWASWV